MAEPRRYCASWMLLFPHGAGSLGPRAAGVTSRRQCAPVILPRCRAATSVRTLTHVREQPHDSVAEAAEDLEHSSSTSSRRSAAGHCTPCVASGRLEEAC